jgi:hypothetical protein
MTPREEATVRQHVHAPDVTRMPREGGEGGAVFVPQAQGEMVLIPTTPREEATVRQHLHARDPTRMPRRGWRGECRLCPTSARYDQHSTRGSDRPPARARPVTRPVCPARVARGVPSLSHKRKVLSSLHERKRPSASTCTPQTEPVCPARVARGCRRCPTSARSCPHSTRGSDRPPARARPDRIRMPREGGEGSAVFVPQAQGLVLTPREEATVRQHVHAPDRIRMPREGGEGVPSLSHKRKVLSTLRERKRPSASTSTPLT